MMNNSEVRKYLGREVVDVVTGFKGICAVYSKVLNGNVQIAIQPKVKEGEITLPDSQWIDINTIDVIGEGIANRVPELAFIPGLELGDQMKDKVSGFIGVANRENMYLSGCHYFTLIGKHNETTGKEPITQNLSADCLELIEKSSVMKTFMQKFTGNEDGKPSRPSGGPGGKLPREAVK